MLQFNVVQLVFCKKRNGMLFKALLLFSLLVLPLTFYAQVWTKKIVDHQLEDLIPYHSSKPVKQVKEMPDIDIEAVLLQDAAEGRTMPRYGVVISTLINKDEGEVVEMDQVMIWKTGIRSRNATSLNFFLKNLSLPEGSEMYIYNSTGTMVSGPVQSKHIFQGRYTTDAIDGEEVIIEVIVPKKDFEAFTIKIEQVVHGFKELEPNKTKAYDDSDECNVDVNCVSGWDDERDAVAFIQASGGTATGVLVNNGCQDITAFFLTAKHNVTLGGSPTNWTFRFNYDSPNPTTPDCRGDELTS